MPLYNLPVAAARRRAAGPRGARALLWARSCAATRPCAPSSSCDGDAPVQVIQPPAPFLLPRVDLSGLPEPAREAAALTLAAEEAGRPFDLARGPMLRGVLLRLAAEDHVVALTMHHIASDGWSMGILVREVTALYAAFAEGEPSPLPELPVQYADFAVWQRSWLRGEVLEREIAWWRRQLAGLPPLLELPTDRPRPAVQSFRGAARPVRLPAGLTRQAEALARREGATLFMVLLAAFQALLARYSGQDDLAVGTPVAGRNRLEIEGLIGFFVNTLVLRGDLGGRSHLPRAARPGARDRARRPGAPGRAVRKAGRGAGAGAEPRPLSPVPGDVRSAERSAGEPGDPGLRLRPVSREATTAKFDLTLSLEEHDGELSRRRSSMPTDLFDASTIDRLIGHFERLLDGLRRAVGPPRRGAPPARRRGDPGARRVERHRQGLPARPRSTSCSPSRRSALRTP